MGGAGPLQWEGPAANGVPFEASLSHVWSGPTAPQATSQICHLDRSLASSLWDHSKLAMWTGSMCIKYKSNQSQAEVKMQTHITNHQKEYILKLTLELHAILEYCAFQSVY